MSDPARWVRRNRYYLLVAFAFVATTALFAVFVIPAWFWHPVSSQTCRALYHAPAQVRDCISYNFHSGVGGEFSEITLVVGLAVFWLKHNCYEHGCPLIARVRGDDGHLRCKHHHKASHPDYG